MSHAPLPRSIILSGGRAAWNVVTSTQRAAALNFSKEQHRTSMICATRSPPSSSMSCADYGTPGTTARSSPTRRPACSSMRPRCSRSITRDGSFRSRDRSTSNAARKVIPIIIQAGGSPPGQELSARSADLVFSVVNGDPAAAKSTYDSLKQRVVKHGRAPEAVAILPGVMPIIGETRRAGEGAARPPAKLVDVDQRADPGVAAPRPRHLRLSARRSGSGISADRPRAGVLQGAARHGAAREDDVARSLQRHRGCARALGRLRHGTADRRHLRGVVHRRAWRTGSSSCRLISPARSTISSIKRGAGAAAARPVPAGIFRLDLARSPWACAALPRGAAQVGVRALHTLPFGGGMRPTRSRWRVRARPRRRSPACRQNPAPGRRRAARTG